MFAIICFVEAQLGNQFCSKKRIDEKLVTWLMLVLKGAVTVYYQGGKQEGGQPSFACRQWVGGVGGLMTIV